MEQADEAEQRSDEQKLSLLLYVAVIVIVAVIVVVIAVIWRKKRKMEPKAKRPPRKEELTISSVTFSGGNTIDVVVDNSGTVDFAIADRRPGCGLPVNVSLFVHDAGLDGGWRSGKYGVRLRRVLSRRHQCRPL